MHQRDPARPDRMTNADDVPAKAPAPPDRDAVTVLLRNAGNSAVARWMLQRETPTDAGTATGLRIEGTLLYDVIEVVQGERQQFGVELIVLAGIAGRIAGLEEERKAHGDASGLERAGDLIGTFRRQRPIGEPDPRGVVKQKRRRHDRAQPARRTSSAAARSAGISRRRIRLARRRRNAAASSRSARTRASFYRAPRITSSPISTRSSPSAWRRSSSAACTGGISVIAGRRRLVGTQWV